MSNVMEMLKNNWQFIVIIIAIIIVVVYMYRHENFIGGSVLLEGETSLDERVAEATKKAMEKMEREKKTSAEAQAPKENLTGSRDIPVFFQDYDRDMVVKNGVLVSREGLVNYEDKINN